MSKWKDAEDTDIYVAEIAQIFQENWIIPQSKPRAIGREQSKNNKSERGREEIINKKEMLGGSVCIKEKQGKREGEYE